MFWLFGFYYIVHNALKSLHFPSINKYFTNPNYSIIALYVRCIQMTQGTEKSFGRYFKTFPVKMVQIVCILTLHQDIISPFVFPEAKCPGTIGSLSLPISRDTLIQRQWTGWVVWVPHCLRIHTITHNPQQVGGGGSNLENFTFWHLCMKWSGI